MTTNDYIKQANDFLTKTNTGIFIKFSHNGKHFDDDTEERDIYTITIKRDKSEFSFKFGQSLTKSGLKRMKRISPTSYDVLACLTKYDPGTFENFCSDFGSDNDSMKAFKTYNALVEEFKNVCRIWNAEERDLLAEIQ